MISVLRLLLYQGCNPNAQDVAGDTPLHDAISERHDEAATILIQHPDINVWLQNIKQFNVMHLACVKGHARAVDMLLSKEPKLVTSAKTDGFMPLHIAAINNHVNEASILLVKGRADVNAKTLNKSTPLHLAASQAYFDMVKLLLTYEADWSVKDDNGNTPLHVCMMGRRTNELFLQLLGLRNLAEDNERIKIANFLIQHGASINDRNNDGNTPITGCDIQHMRDAVSAYAANNKPTVAHRPKARPSTAKVEQEIFTTSKQKCHKCAANLADVRFLPCKHQISCHKCCFKFKKCPICEKEITRRVDKDNYTVESSCVIS
ncbi:E3 ubiquitin-protein ligase MIB2-like [Mercenaria mercenaria]|uniref:E3 ubiquitin-protein ligase MIB2-like n=1 Tax=Mercenaria mercenaria TaxID=6596 RepID=UPI00234EA9CD|nr:E3 ubiquitin-protein ligase MIB2-like [Mercenaria mercenaria]